MAFGRLQRAPGAQPMSDINMTPLIDVMLVLLVIFMITAPLITPGEITLPSVGSVLTTPVAPMQIQIKRDATLMLKEGTASPVRVSRDELIARIQARQKQSPEQAVVIAADSDVRYEAVVAVLDMLQRNKVSKVGLLARRQPG